MRIQRTEREREDRELLCPAWLSAAGVGVVCVWYRTSEEQCVGRNTGEIPAQTGGNCMYTLSCLQSLPQEHSKNTYFCLVLNIFALQNLLNREETVFISRLRLWLNIPVSRLDVR